MEEKTLKARIMDFASDRYYFHIDHLRKLFAETDIYYKENTLKQYLTSLKKNGNIHDAGKGWYSTLDKEFLLDSKPIKEIIMLIKNRFPLIDFSCWSTAQIKSFYLHLPSIFVTFINANTDFLRPLKDFLAGSAYEVYLNPRKDEVEKYVELTNLTIILRPSIYAREPKKAHVARIEKIIVDLYMETRKLNLMDMDEYKKVAAAILRSSRINVAETLDYAERRKIRDRIIDILSISMAHS